VEDTTFRWWHCSFPLSKNYAYHGTKHWLESIQIYDNRVVAGVQAAVSDFWPTWDGLPSLFLAIHIKRLWSACGLATWNNWLAVWFNFRTKFVLASLGTFYQYLFPSYQWRSQLKNWGRGKTFDFRWITLFCLEKRLSMHKMTAF